MGKDREVRKSKMHFKNYEVILLAMREEDTHPLPCVQALFPTANPFEPLPTCIWNSPAGSS